MQIAFLSSRRFALIAAAGAVVALASASGGPDDEHDKTVRLCQRKHVVPGASRVLRR